MWLAFVYIVLLLPYCLLAQTIDDNHRIDCYPEPLATQEKCESRGCLWTPAHVDNDPTVPWCYMPAGTGYTLNAGTYPSFVLTKKTDSIPNPWDTDISPINVDVSNIGATLRVKIGPATGR